MVKEFFKNKVTIIAEMGNAHEGDINTAKRIAKFAYEVGADAIKFQKFSVDELVEPDHEKYDLFKSLEMSGSEWKELINYVKSSKLKIFVDVFGLKSAREISKFSIEGFKIHSSDLNNSHLLHFFSSKKKPILLSVAGAKLNELDESLRILLKEKKDITLMYGFQGYPTSLNDLNLEDINELKKRYNHPIGISDHVAGDSEMSLIVPLLGIGLGARVVEKHITIDRKKKGIDYQSSLEPSGFKKLVSLIRMTEKSLPKKNLEMRSKEMEYRLNHKKNTVSKKFLKKDTILKESFFEFKRTREKIESVPYFDFVGRKLAKNIQKGNILTPSFLKKQPKVVAVIACRIGSDRLFAKPLQPIGNHNILEQLLNQLRKSTFLEDIILAISENPGNDIFVNFAKQNNLKFIEGDDRDVLKRLIQGANYVNADTVLRVTSENPYIYWEGIDDLIKKHFDGNYDLTTYSDLPLGSSIEIIKLKALEQSHKFGTKLHRSELCTLYINENPKKFKIFRIKPASHLCRPEIRLTVDTPQDLFVAKIIYESLNKRNESIKLKNVIKFLDDNPNIKNLNADITIEYKRY